MNDPRKIDYYDLREEARANKLSLLIGRSEEMERFNRVIERKISSNILIVGPDGVGKTTLVRGWMRELSRLPRYETCALVELGVEHVYALADHYALEEHYKDAFHSLPRSVLFIDDFGREVYRNQDLMQRISRLYAPMLKRRDVHVVLALEPHEYDWLLREYPAFVHLFESARLKRQSAFECTRILRTVLPRLNSRDRITVPDGALKDVITFAERFPVLGQLPRSAIHLLDEALSYSASKQQNVLSRDSIAHVVEIKTGVPKTRLTQDELENVKKLEQRLNARIVNQGDAIVKIAQTLQRAKLGLRSHERPLGSFLLLGPSGVGKTETAKCVAELLFDRADAMLRFDMSEFQQDHTIQRLIGAPAGYVGYEEGGALTNALKREPHSLILLDEIEKAHPKVFDVFLQVLDEGRLTSGQNETVDARNSILMATSNAAVSEILQLYRENPDASDESFLKEKILPILAKTFRLEFLNRFDSILVFKPLTLESLFKIAQLEIRKVEKRFEEHRVRFEIDADILKERIRRMADPRFGARPVKRLVEDTCETLLMQSLLRTS